MASHHPDHALLLDYATGALNQPMSLVIATHLALCPSCRHEVAALEAIGGAMLESDGVENLPAGALARTMAQIEGLPCSSEIEVPRAEAHPEIVHLPRPLRDVIPVAPDGLRWGKQGPIETIFLPCDEPGHLVRLLRIAPGKGAPQHSHRGTELTLVLQGSFSDEGGQYGPGDLEYADSDVDHRPIADPGEACICLAVTDAPLRLTGPLGRFIDPFLSI